MRSKSTNEGRGFSAAMSSPLETIWGALTATGRLLELWITISAGERSPEGRVAVFVAAFTPVA